jgi:ABC-type transport system involved in cytochrome c biogenesis permease subunit
MLERISITCFLASYAVALALELSRLLFRSGVRGALMLGFGVAGLVAHTLFLAHRAYTASALPLSSEFDFYLVAAWALAIVYLYLIYYHPHNLIGLFVLPLVIGFVVVANWFASQAPFPRNDATWYWGLAHGVCQLLGTVVVTLGFVTGVMYLVQARRLKQKVPADRGLRLPSLEWLQRVNGRTIVVAVLLLAGGFLAGIVLNQIQRRESGTGVPWTDPIVFSSSILVGWMIVAWLFNLLYRPAQQGRKVAYLTVASFAFLLVVLATFLADTEHGARTGDGKAQANRGLRIADCGMLELRNAECGMRNGLLILACSNSALRAPHFAFREGRP